MFSLENNNFIDKNSCSYRDEHGNIAFMRKEDGRIVAKLRFADKRIKSSAMNIPFPVNPGTEGDRLHLEYPNEGLLSKKDVKDGIDNFTQLINYWIHMLYDIALLNADNELFKKANGKKYSAEDIARYKISRLLPYKELQPILKVM